MTEKDFERIGQLMDSKLEPINAKLNQIDARLDGMDARFQQIDARFETFKSEIISEFDHLLKIQCEEFFHEFKVATEGYAALTERVDRLEDRVEGDETKVA